MPKITFIDPDGRTLAHEGEEGLSLMEVAVRNGVPGIEADCGGACACATCHVYVDQEWFEKTGGPSENEASMLEFASEPQATSRLSCQIRVSRDLDGLVVTLPFSQH